MGINLDKYREKKENMKRSGGSGDFWIPRDGKNIIRIFSFKHRVNDHDIKIGRISDDYEIDDLVEEIDVQQDVHFVNNKPFNCSGQNCEICDDALRKNDKSMNARQRFYVNAIVLMEGDKKLKDNSLRIATLTKTVYNDILSYVLDIDYGVKVLGVKGRDFIIEYDSSQQGTDMYRVKIRDKDVCDDFSDLEIEPTDLMEVDALKPNFHSKDDGDDNFKKKKRTSARREEEPEEEEQPKKKKKKQEEEPEEEEQPKKKKKSEDGEFEIGETLAFDDKELGHIEGELVEIDKNKKGDTIYVIKNQSDNDEYEGYSGEVYRPEKKKSSPRKRR